MRIVCDNCQTNYIVPDEKIVKNVFRFTCQKCGRVITTRVEEAAEQDMGTLGKWRAAGSTAPKRTQDDSPIWYYSYNGSSNGPFTEAELLQKFRSPGLVGIAKHCYVWQKAFSEWKPAIDVDPFASAILMPPPPKPLPPAPRPVLDDNLPPLFSDKNKKINDPATNKQSSPDVRSLKQRLHQTDAPKQPQVVLNTAASDHMDDDDTPTRHLEMAPMPSFQSLDAIAPTIQVVSKDGGAKPLNKVLPSISTLPAIKPAPSGTKSVGNLPAVKPGKSLSSSGLPAIKSGNLPTVPALKSTSSLPTISALRKNPSTSNLPTVTVDPKIPASSKSTALTVSYEKNSSADLSDVDLENVDIDIESSGMNEILGDAAEDLPDIDVDKSGQDNSLDSNDLSNIDLEVEDEADQQKLMSSADMLAMIGQSKANLDTVKPQNEPVSEDVAEIDLDDEVSEFFTNEEIDNIKNSQPESASSNGILSNSEDLFGDADENLSNNVAHVSLNKLEKIQAKHSDLFEELARAEVEEEKDRDNSLSESSMLIQLEHFNRVQQKDKNKTKLIVFGVIAALILIGVGGFAVSKFIASTDDAQNKPVIAVENDGLDPFGQVTGRSVQSDELDETLVPKDDFEIVAVVADSTSSGHKHHRSKSGSAAAKNTETPTDDDQVEQVDLDEETKENTGLGKKSEKAVDSLYGDDDSDSDDKPATAAAVKQDGRANVVLKRDEFASTKGVQGTKYQINTGNAPSSREQFTIGLKNVSKSVQECHAREAKTGGMAGIPKIYIQLTVAPSGVVENFKVEEKTVPGSFVKCLESKKDRWKFAPFDGDSVKMRQGFVLN